MSMFLYMEIINLVVRCLNVYFVMDRCKTGRVAKKVVVLNMALSFLFFFFYSGIGTYSTSI